MSHEDYKIPKLNGENYHAWSIRARASLVQKRCWEAVDPGFGVEMKENERKKNEEALTLLFLIVEDTFLDDIGECQRASEAWSLLRKIHTQYGLLHILQLMRDFFNVSMKPGESIKEYLGRLMDIHRKLTDGGYAFTDREVSLVMLMGLPKNYEPLILNLEKDEDSLTTATVKARLIVEEKRISRKTAVLTENFGEMALTTNNTSSQNKYSKKQFPVRKANNSETHEENKRRSTRCFSCGKWGHISKYCEEAKKRNNAANTVVSEEIHHALKVDDQRTNNSSLWILDSGCTEHMSAYREKFISLKPTNSKIELANSEKIEAVGIGDIILSPVEKCGKEKIKLEDVLYVPGLGGNLLSVGRIEQKSYSTNFKEGKARIYRDEHKDPILTAHRCGRLYKIEEKCKATYITRHENKDLLHRRLGHLHMEAVKKMERTENFNSNTEDRDKELCTICVLGKMKKSKFPTEQAKRASKPLEIIHSDVVGPINPLADKGFTVTPLFLFCI